MTGSGSCHEIRHSLGVYVLGAIDPAERAAVDTHLVGCPACREELAGLAGLPALLRRVPAAEAERLAAAGPAGSGPPPEALLASLLARARAVRRARRWRWLAAAAAAVLVAVAAGTAAGGAFQPGPRPATASWQQEVSATDSATGVRLTVKYAPTSWGTLMSVQVVGPPAGITCQFRVIDTSGRVQTVGTWRLSYRGGPAWYPAATAVADRDLRGFELTSGGRLLAWVPVS
jgi:hypothetical protein